MGYDLLKFLKQIRGPFPINMARITPEIQTNLKWIREMDRLSVKQKQRIAMAIALAS